MKYTILEILPGQIRVEFEDNSWAIVPVKPNATLDEIDDAVSQYDPDFLLKPESIINPDIYIGEERSSIKKVTTPISSNIGIGSTVPSSVSHIPSVPLAPNNHINTAIIAEYYASQGDNRIKDALMQNVEKYISETKLNADKLISDLSYNPDDIFAQAEAELNAEQS